MMRAIGKPSRIKDGLGVAVLAGTALLYAFQGSGHERPEACLGCDTPGVGPAAAPAVSPAAPESLISSESLDAGTDPLTGQALPAAVTPPSHLLQKADLQREAH